MSTMLTFLWIIPVFCLVLFAIPYVAGPPLVRAKFWAAAWPEVTHVFEAHVPPAVAAFFSYSEAQFAAFGFSPSGDVRIQYYMDRQITELRTFRNDHTLESGGAVCVRQSLPNGTEQSVFTLSISTEFANRREIGTSNAEEIGPLTRTPDWEEVRLPGVTALEAIVRVHRMRESEFETAAAPVLPPPGGELSAVRDTLRRHTDHYADAGYFRLDQAGRRYRLTWKGAAVLSWQQLWPVKQLRLRAAHREAERLIMLSGGSRAAQSLPLVPHP
jgi:hypothetical protein